MNEIFEQKKVIYLIEQYSHCEKFDFDNINVSAYDSNVDRQSVRELRRVGCYDYDLDEGRT